MTSSFCIDAMRRLFAYSLVVLLASASNPIATAGGPELDAPTAIKNITIVPAPGEKIESGTILMDKGRIVAAGMNVVIPPGTRELDGTGLIAYAGFVDGLSRTGLEDVGVSAPAERRSEGEFPLESDGPQATTVEANRNGIFARRRVENLLNIEETTFEKIREQGFSAALVSGPKAILGGTASVIQLGGGPLRRSIVLSEFGQTASFDPPDRRAIGTRGRYPSATFGVIAHFRQVMLDAKWYRDMGQYVGRHPDARGDRPLDGDLDALQPVLDGKLPVLWEANTADEILRVLKLADEFKFRPIIVGGREAHKVADRLKAGNVPVIVSLKLPPEIKEYKLDAKKTRKAADDESLFGKEWEKRPFAPKSAYEIEKRLRDEIVANAGKLEQAGIAWCWAGYELKDSDDALKNVREAITGGLSADAALRGLTSGPAKLMGVEQNLGAIRPGASANLTVMNKPLTEKEAKIRWVFVAGKQYKFDVSADSKKGKEEKGKGARRGGKKGSTESEDADEPEEDTELDEDLPASQTVVAKKDDADKSGGASSKPATDEKVATKTPATTQETDEKVVAGPYDDLLLNEPTWPTESDIERNPGIQTGGSVLLRNVTVLTVSGEDLKNTTVLIEKGKITAIGAKVEAPAGLPVFDLNGFVIMPGIIDPHSHIALDAVNEGSLSVTPEVRCDDVVRHDDVNIYRALTGGTTTIHSMHGSANTIGGQNVILKLKYGRPAAEQIVADRQRTVKFALGENVKRPGMAPRGPEPREVRRFPGTRMGVEATMRRAFSEARQYGEKRAEFDADAKAGKEPAPLRRDLRLEALSDILNGRIWVHCHCYRADEILRLLSVAEDFGFRIFVLQHVLEGYRVMPEILRHGCGASTFSDWWAYKIEAYNAIPQNAGMMTRFGINTTVNSDSADLIRHLNFEAAKCLKYSGLTPNETLRLCTLNGARQLGLEKRIGSIELGKDGDIAIFNGHPLDTFSKCVMTLIEGEVYFRDRDFDPVVTKSPGRPMKEFAVASAAPAAHDGAANAVVARVESGAAAKARKGSDDAGQAGATESGVRHGPRPTGENGEAGGSSAGTTGTTESTAGVFAVVNAEVHPVSSPAIPGGTLVIRNGKIAAIGKGLPVPADAKVIDAKGLHVYPGLINAGTSAGLHEIGQVEVTVDTGETGTYQPDTMAVSAFNPFSAMIEVTRAEGITTALIMNDSPTVAGQAGLVDLDGWSMAEMAIEPKAGLVVTLPGKPAEPIVERERRRRGGRRAQDDEEKDDESFNKAMNELAQFFRDAKLFATATVEARKKKIAPPIAGDSRFEAMIPYVLGEKPVLFNADEYKAILEAVLFAEQLGLKPIIYGGRDAWKLADVLVKRNVPVIYDGVFAVPRAVEQWDCNYDALAVMAKAGVKFCTATRDASLSKLLPIEAGFAVAHGLSADDAIRALTLSAAEILGVGDRLGSLEVGKIANVIITTDHPCQATNIVTHEFIRGRPVSLESQHTRFAEKFTNRPAPELPMLRADMKGPPSQSVKRSESAAVGH